jgi:hypothetical protein
VPERIAGAILALAGFALLAAGALEVVDPAAFDELLAPIVAPFRD